MNLRALLHAEYQRQKTIPFVWGQSDCACTAADMIAPIIGRDVMAHLRGTYDSEIGAKRIMVANGWPDMGAFAASLFTEVPMGQVRTGDWVQFVNADGSDGIGVACGAQFLARSPRGLTTAPLGFAVRGFRVE